MVILLKDYLTQTKAGEILGIHRVTIWRWMTAGKLTYVLVGGRQLIPRSEVEALARENKQAMVKEAIA